MGSPSTVPADKHVGPYRLVRELGRGGMGRVYEAVRDGRPYAVKVFSATHGNLDFLRKRFCVEARILSRLDHPHLVRVHELLVDESDGTPYWLGEAPVTWRQWRAVRGESFEGKWNGEGGAPATYLT